MKKLKIAVFAVIFAVNCFGNVYAHRGSSNDFGKLLGNPVTFDNTGSTGATNAVYLHGTNLTMTYGKTKKVSHTGTTSAYVNASSGTGTYQLANGGTKYINDAKNTTIYAEVYVKGIDYSISENRSQASPVLFLKQGDTNIKQNKSWHFEQPDENGWVRAWGIIEADVEFDGIFFSFQFDNTGSLAGIDDVVYIDDMRLISAPKKLVIDDAISDDSRLELNKLIAYGTDFYNEKSRIIASDMINYSVTGGNANAYIDDYGRLVAVNAGEANVMAEFLGRKCAFSVIFSEGEGGIYADVPEVPSDGKLIAEIYNTSDDDCTLKLLTVLKDDDRLVKLIVSPEITTEAFKTSKIEIDVSNIPFYVKAPQYTTFVLVNKGGLWLPIN